ncbi:MAG: PilW family protein [Methylococcaceae bacterium]|jgi:type IV pilus assembly protein PilW
MSIGTNRLKQQGVTLIEIMIALLIGAFVLGGVLQIFTTTRQTYRMQDNLSRLQENARLAIEFLSFDTRMSGFLGCPNLASITPTILAQPQNPNTLTSLPTLPLTLGVLVSGTDNVAANWNTNACSAANACTANTDVITLQYGGGCGANLVGNLASDNANIQISDNNTCGLQQYDVLLISDCTTADIFIATNVSNGTGTQTIAHANNQNTQPKLSKAYPSDAEVFVLRTFSYFIRTGSSGRPALWRLDNAKPVSTTNPIEVVEGVENMQVTYGADTDTDGVANYYVAAGTAGLNLTTVSSVRISLLMATLEDRLSVNPVSYFYNGATSTPGDNRIRRVFTSTIELRN